MVLVATKDGYVFTPRFQQINVGGGNITQNFLASSLNPEEYTISGRVVTDSGDGIRDVTVEITCIDLNGQLVGHTVTGTDGNVFL